MKTNMRLTTVVAAALLVVLAGSGIAGAATITLSIVIDDNALEIGESTTYSIYGMVTDNYVEDNYGVPFEGGIASFKVDQIFTGSAGGAIRHLQAAGPPSTTSAATTVALATNVAPDPVGPFVAKNNGVIMNGSWVPTALGTGGVNDTYGAQAPAGGYDYYEGGRLLYGSGEAALLFVGTYVAVADGTVDILVDRGEAGSCLVWTVGGDGETTIAKVAEIVIPGAGQIIVGSAVTPPTIVIDTLGVGKGGWTQEADWNNDLHEVLIESTITDGPAAVVWTLTNPNPSGSTHPLDATGDDFILTMLEINTKFAGEVPATGGIPGYIYDWTLTASVDGGNSMDSITVFVPEPATMGLLAFGVVGLLKRRRRA